MARSIVKADELTLVGGGQSMPNHDSLQLRSAVHNAYSAAAERPTQKHAFPVGRLLAERLGYPVDLLDALPPAAVEAFAGSQTWLSRRRSPLKPASSTSDVGQGSTA